MLPQNTSLARQNPKPELLMNAHSSVSDCLGTLDPGSLPLYPTHSEETLSHCGSTLDSGAADHNPTLK